MKASMSEVDSASTVKAAECTSARSILAVVVLVMWFTAMEAPMATAPALLPLLAVDTATAPGLAVTACGVGCVSPAVCQLGLLSTEACCSDTDLCGFGFP